MTYTTNPYLHRFPLPPNSPHLTTIDPIIGHPPPSQPHRLRLRHLHARSPLPARGRAERLEFHAAGTRCHGRGAGARYGGSVLWRAAGWGAGAGTGLAADEEYEG